MGHEKVQVSIDAEVRDRYKARAALRRGTIGDEIRFTLDEVERIERQMEEDEREPQSLGSADE